MTMPVDAGTGAIQGLASSLPDAAMCFTLLFARMGALLMLLPAFSDDAVPGRIRLMIALAISAGLYPLLSPHMTPAIGMLANNDMGFAAIVGSELLLGIALGLIVRLFFHAIFIAGGIISLQVGLTSALINDPSAGGQIPILAKFISIAALLLCMGLGVHHLWLGAMVRSYDIFPPGTVPNAGDFLQLALMAARGAITLGLGLAAPLIVYGIVFNVVLGLAARLALSLQVFFITQPLNLLLGLMLCTATLAASLTSFADAMAHWVNIVWGPDGR
jgi:flagellar biosynthetic protein FliR